MLQNCKVWREAIPDKKLWEITTNSSREYTKKDSKIYDYPLYYVS